VTRLLTPADVARAAGLIADHVVRTPLVPSPQPGLWLKLECQQRSGAFKARGAYAALSALTPGQRSRGVVTHSSGNHGRALAEAAAALRCPVTVVVPDTAPPHKLAAVRAAGAEVEVVPAAEREQAAAAQVRRRSTTTTSSPGRGRWAPRCWPRPPSRGSGWCRCSPRSAAAGW